MRVCACVPAASLCMRTHARKGYIVSAQAAQTHVVPHVPPTQHHTNKPSDGFEAVAMIKSRRQQVQPMIDTTTRLVLLRAVERRRRGEQEKRERKQGEQRHRLSAKSPAPRHLRSHSGYIDRERENGRSNSVALSVLVLLFSAIQYPSNVSFVAERHTEGERERDRQRESGSKE